MSEIKRLSECDSPGMVDDPDGDYVTYADHLAAVEAAVMAEREACAEVCDSKVFALDNSGAPYRREATASQCAKAIRSRTTQPAKEAG